MWAIFLIMKSQMNVSPTFCWGREEKKKMTHAHKKTGSHLDMNDLFVRYFLRRFFNFYKIFGFFAA